MIGDFQSYTQLSLQKPQTYPKLDIRNFYLEKPDGSSHEQASTKTEISVPGVQTNMNSLRTLHYIAHLKNTLANEYKLKGRVELKNQFINLEKFTETIKKYCETLQTTKKIEIEDILRIENNSDLNQNDSTEILRGKTEETHYEQEEPSATKPSSDNFIESFDHRQSSSSREENDFDPIERNNGNTDEQELGQVNQNMSSPILHGKTWKSGLREKDRDDYIESLDYKSSGKPITIEETFKDSELDVDAVKVDFGLDEKSIEEHAELVGVMQNMGTEVFNHNSGSDIHHKSFEENDFDPSTDVKKIEEEEEHIMNFSIVTEAVTEESIAADGSFNYQDNKDTAQPADGQDSYLEYLEYNQNINNTEVEDNLESDIQEESPFEDVEMSKVEGNDDVVIPYQHPMYLETRIVSDATMQESSSGKIIDPLERPIIVSRSDSADDTDNLLALLPSTLSHTNKQASQGKGRKSLENRPSLEDDDGENAGSEVGEEALDTDITETTEDQDLIKGAALATTELEDIENVEEKQVQLIPGNITTQESEREVDTQDKELSIEGNGDHQGGDTVKIGNITADVISSYNNPTEVSEEETAGLSTKEAILTDITHYEREIESFEESGVTSSQFDLEMKYLMELPVENLNISNSSDLASNQKSENDIEVSEQFHREKGEDPDHLGIIQNPTKQQASYEQIKSFAKEGKSAEDFGKLEEIHNESGISPGEVTEGEVFGNRHKDKKKASQLEVMFHQDNTEEEAGSEKSNSQKADGELRSPLFHVRNSLDNQKDKKSPVFRASVGGYRQRSPWSDKFKFLSVGKKVLMILRRE